MAYNRRLYDNLPIYAQLADDKRLLEVLCDFGIQPLIDSVFRKLSQREAFFDPTHPLSRDHILFLSQFAGLSGNRDRWLGVGLNPDWDWETQLDVLLRAPAYWKIVGTERGIREAISMWLRYNGGIKFYQPFGHTPRSQPRWADYLTPYDHYACRNLEDARILGMAECHAFKPPWQRFVTESWEWDYSEPFGLELEDVTPALVSSTDAAMGPRNAWKFFDLDEQTWHQIFPLINKLDIESVPSLTRPTNVGWLSYRLSPFDARGHSKGEKTNLLGELCYDSNGFQYGNTYRNSAVYIWVEEVVRETRYEFPGNYFFCYQYSDIFPDFGRVEKFKRHTISETIIAEEMQATYGDRLVETTLPLTQTDQSRGISYQSASYFDTFGKVFAEVYSTEIPSIPHAQAHSFGMNLEGGSLFGGQLTINDATTTTTHEHEPQRHAFGGEWQERTVTTSYLASPSATYADCFYGAAFTRVKDIEAQVTGDYLTPFGIAAYQPLEGERIYSDLEYWGGTRCFYNLEVVSQQTLERHIEPSLPFGAIAYVGSYLVHSTRNSDVVAVTPDTPYADPIKKTVSTVEQSEEESVADFTDLPQFYYAPYSFTEIQHQITQEEILECEPGMESEVVVGHQVIPAPVPPQELPRLKVRELPDSHTRTTRLEVESGTMGATYADPFTWVGQVAEFHAQSRVEIKPEHIFLLTSPARESTRHQSIIEAGIPNNGYDSLFGTPFGYPAITTEIDIHQSSPPSYQFSNIADYWTPFDQMMVWWQQSGKPKFTDTSSVIEDDEVVPGIPYYSPPSEIETVTETIERGGLQIIGGMVPDYLSIYGNSCPFDSFQAIPAPTSPITYEPIYQTVSWCGIPATYTTFEIDQWFEQVVEVTTPLGYESNPDLPLMGLSSSWHLVLDTNLGLTISTPMTLYWTQQPSFLSKYEERSLIFNAKLGFTTLYLEFVFEPDANWVMGGFTLNLNSRALLSDSFDRPLQLPQRNVAGFRFLIPVTT